MHDSTKTDTVEMLMPTHNPEGERPHLSSAMVQVDVAGLSDRGKVRPNNEDHYLVVRFGRFLETLLTNLPEGEVPRRTQEVGYGMIVADGVGGASGGEVASRLAIRTCINLVLDVPDWILRLDTEGFLNDEFAQEVMRRASERAHRINAVLAETAEADPQLRGMGTTMTMAWSVGIELFIAHIGDSRAYVLRRGQLVQLTRDHTLAQALADEGQISQQEVAKHYRRHMLTRWLGGALPGIEAEVQRVALADGDCLLLCTDGLTEMVPEEAIAAVLGGATDAEHACQRLVDLALGGGGKDNVTVVVARYRFPPPV